MQTQRKTYGGLDGFRLAAALLVVAIHTSPLASFSDGADFFFTRVLARVAVPFFFMVTGHFMLSGLFSENPQEYDMHVTKGKKRPVGRLEECEALSPSHDVVSHKIKKHPADASVTIKFPHRIKKYLLRISLLYAGSIVLYLPLGIYAGHYKGLTFSGALRMLFFDGTFYHLWYFPACTLGVLLLLLMSRFLTLRAAAVLSGLLYLVGLFGDSYFGLVQRVPFLNAAYEGMFRIFSYTRNGLFLAPAFLILGIFAGKLPGGTYQSSGRARQPSGSPESARHSVTPHKNLENPVAACKPRRAKALRLTIQSKTDTAKKEPRLPLLAALLALSFCAMTAEAFLLRHFEIRRHDSMYFFLIPVSFFLYHCLLAVPAASRRSLRTVSAWIYVLHPAFIVVVRGVAKLLRLTELLIDNSLIHYLAVSILSVGAGLFLTWLGSVLRRTLRRSSRKLDSLSSSKDMLSPKNGSDFGTAVSGSRFSPTDAEAFDGTESSLMDARNFDGTENSLTDAGTFDGMLRETKTLPGTERAWIELDREALAQNVRYLQSLLPEGCRLMPTVKANAYGHGARLIAEELNRLGVHDFCVASLSEGIELREAGISGQILILGYTHPSQFPLLNRYRLTQTVLDFDYAKRLQSFGQRLHVHIAVDTGMHRLGIRCEDWRDILSVYRMQNLVVDGIFTHLAACDSSEPPCRAFTESQIDAFYQTVDSLEEAGCSCSGLHLLSSYGIINYPDVAADYVRPGIALYGLLSTDEDSRCVPALRPVLSLYARVASVRTLQPGESAGYGITFTADRRMKVAVLSIGYGDGLPRSLSRGNGRVLINGYSAPILGRVCMDQTLADVSGIPRIAQGDIAVLIGRSDEEEITAGELALRCDTISNEILSRLGERLERILRGKR
ncbi:MAG: serine racemase VanT catalytic subunit [Roseburia sp.]|nr:serine racemase VanT catalytic subunit [Roseburia sp.]MCM1098149.1 serine racemase VanT catalytic subunit [Ruminococcus flavefaciens]